MFSVSIFCSSYLFLTWDTYSGGLGTIANGFKYLGCLLLPCLLILRKRPLRISLKLALLFLFGLMLQIHICFLGSTYKSPFNVTIITLFVNLLCFFLLNTKERSQIYKYALYIFAVICLPSLIYFICNTLGINLPNSILYSDQQAKISHGVYYLHYPLGLLIHQNGSFLYRMTGVFDEAGFVGTIAALFIASGYKKVDKKWIMLLLIEGIFSLSMAFYLLLIIFVIAYSIRQGALKFGISLMVLLIAFIIFINVDFHNSYIRALQNRIDLSSAILVEDNRTSSKFDSVYEDFVRDKNYEFYMGYGKNAVASNDSINASYSYKCLIYDYGIIGFAIYVLFFVFAALILGVNRDTIPFLIVFFASMYQRPYVFTTMYVIIYLSALEMMNTIAKDKQIHRKTEKFIPKKFLYGRRVKL